MSDDYIEKAQRRLIEADKIMRAAASDDVLTSAEEAQIQATIAVGYILLKISDQLSVANSRNR